MLQYCTAGDLCRTSGSQPDRESSGSDSNDAIEGATRRLLHGAAVNGTAITEYNFHYFLYGKSVSTAHSTVGYDIQNDSLQSRYMVFCGLRLIHQLYLPCGLDNRTDMRAACRDYPCPTWPRQGCNGEGRGREPTDRQSELPHPHLLI